MMTYARMHYCAIDIEILVFFIVPASNAPWCRSVDCSKYTIFLSKYISKNTSGFAVLSYRTDYLEWNRNNNIR